MTILFNYSLALIPGLIVLAGTYFLLPKKEKLLKLVVLIFGFILMRDAMTPAGIWQFGINEGVMWLRFIESHLILLIFAVLSVGLSLLILRYYSPDYQSINWFGKGTMFQSILAGLIGSLIAAGPFLWPYFSTSLAERGGAVAVSFLPTLLIFAIGGNFLEEVLFRELLQTHLSKSAGSVQSMILSALFFAMGHIFLATTVTDLGPLILVFTFWEGLVCAWLQPRYGLAAATAAHGLTIFILASGLI